MKTYHIHLYPEPYGFRIKAENSEKAIELAKKRWENNDCDFDCSSCDFGENVGFKVVYVAN